MIDVLIIINAHKNWYSMQSQTLLVSNLLTCKKLRDPQDLPASQKKSVMKNKKGENHWLNHLSLLSVSVLNFDFEFLASYQRSANTKNRKKVGLLLHIVASHFLSISRRSTMLTINEKQTFSFINFSRYFMQGRSQTKILGRAKF